MAECLYCLGRGEITGPKSVAYEYDPSDPFNAERRECEDCEGTGVMDDLRAAALLAHADQKVQRALNKLRGLPGDPR